MKGIDRLREYVKDAPASSMGEMARAIVAGMADEIERDERSLRGFAERLEAAASERADVTLFGVDYTALPVDADGVPIHVGERVQLIGNDPSTVSHMSLAGDGWRVYVKYDGDLGTGSGEPSRIRHHHAPTVEDVLREFAHVGIRIAAKHGIKAGEIDFYADEEAIAEFADKLRLAGDE